jgi:hypothetical protein
MILMSPNLPMVTAAHHLAKTAEAVERGAKADRETDPPDHEEYWAILEPFFRRDSCRGSSVYS